MRAKPQCLRAESPAFPTRTAIPIYTKPGHTLGCTVAAGGKENEGRGTCKERRLAFPKSWGDLNSELTEEISLFSAGFGPLQKTRHQLYLELSPGCVRLTLWPPESWEISPCFHFQRKTSPQLYSWLVWLFYAEMFCVSHLKLVFLFIPCILFVFRSGQSNFLIAFSPQSSSQCSGWILGIK